MSENKEVKETESPEETSTTVAILKTAAFFAVLIGLGWFLMSYSSKSAPKEADLKKDYTEITFEEISNYDYYTPIGGGEVDQELLAKNKIPDEVKALNGKKVSLSGFMLPLDTDDKGYVSLFNLNGSYDMCYFGAPVYLNQWVAVKMKEGKKIPWTHKLITIYGTLEVGEEKKDGVVMSIYRMVPDVVATPLGVVK